MTWQPLLTINWNSQYNQKDLIYTYKTSECVIMVMWQYIKSLMDHFKTLVVSMTLRGPSMQTG